MKIAPEPLTAAAFAPFGQVLAAIGPGPQREPFAARMHTDREHARPNMTFMRVAPDTGPVELRQLERHPHSNQTFVPMNGTRQLVAVCPSSPDGRPLFAGLRVFVAGAGQAINYDANVWHAPRVALCEPGEFVMFRWDNGGAGDIELVDLPQPVTVVVEART